MFSPNGKYIAAWTLDGSIRLWDYVSSNCKKTYQGHENIKYSLGGAFGVYSRGAFLVSGSEDGRIVLWDVKSKDVLQTLHGHDGPVLWADTHPASEHIVTCGLDGTIKLWINDELDAGLVNGVAQMLGDDFDDSTPKLENDDTIMHSELPNGNGETSQLRQADIKVEAGDPDLMEE
jgi:COMPASS component SWD3